MFENRAVEFPAGVGNQVKAIAARRREPFEVNCEDSQQDSCHTKSGDIGDEQEDGEQDLIEHAAQISSEGAQQVTKNPADNNCRKLEGNCPPDRRSDNIGYFTGILAE